MGRRLPWKNSEPAAATASSSPASAVKKARDSPKPLLGVKREAAASGSPSGTTRRGAETPRSRVLRDREFTRSPSTSPPPEPPKEELMIAGLNHDDRYRMVEDEFLSVAQRFTTHLHRAEYSRLRSLAASQNAAAIKEVERPVVRGSSITAEGRVRGEVRRKEKRQRAVLEEDEGRGLGGLRGLLESPRKERRTLGRIRSGAGSGANVSRSQEVSVEDDTVGEETGDEPELPPLRLAMTSRPSRPTPSAAPPESATRPAPKVTPKTTPRPGSTARSTAVVEIEDDDDDDPFGVAKRRAERKKSREQMRKSAPGTKVDRDNTMPSFS